MFRVLLAQAICPSTHVVAPFEPTPKMKRAASKAMSPGERAGKPWVSNSEKHGIRYKFMILAYLAEVAQ